MDSVNIINWVSHGLMNYLLLSYLKLWYLLMFFQLLLFLILLINDQLGHSLKQLESIYKKCVFIFSNNLPCEGLEEECCD